MGHSTIAGSNVSLESFTNTEIENLVSAVEAAVSSVNVSGMTISQALASLDSTGSSTANSEISIASLDLTGTWSYVETSGSNNCGDPVGVTLAVETLDISQTGNAITVRVGSQVIATGNLSGTSIVDLPLESGPDDGGFWTETSQTFTVSVDGSTVNGSISWTWTGGGFTCSGTDSVVLTRI